MPRSPRPSSKAISTVVEDRGDPTLPVILEFQMPSTTITTAPVPRSARGIVWIVASMLVAVLLAMGLIPVDRVVTAQGRVVSRSATLVLQPLEAAIVRSIDVHEGETVQAGQVLARLDPTFAAADVGALAAQVSSLQAQVSRLQAESRRPAVHLFRDRPESGAAGGDLRPAPGRVQFQARELHAEDQRPGVCHRQGEFRCGRIPQPPAGGEQCRADAA